MPRRVDDQLGEQSSVPRERPSHARCFVWVRKCGHAVDKQRVVLLVAAPAFGIASAAYEVRQEWRQTRRVGGNNAVKSDRPKDLPAARIVVIKPARTNAPFSQAARAAAFWNSGAASPCGR